MSLDDAQLVSQLDSLPNCLKYGAKQLQIRIARNTNLLPVNSDAIQGNGSGTCRFRFPSASIIDLASTTISFNATIDGLTNDPTNYVQALFPASYKYIKRVIFYLGGIAVSGSLLNSYAQVYHAMVRAIGNKEFVQSKVLEGYTELFGYDASGLYLTNPPGATSKTTYQQITDFLLLAKANGGCSEVMIDTSIFNDLEMQIDFEGQQILSVYRNGSATESQAAAVKWSLANLRLNVNCVSSVPPIYASFLSVRSQNSAPIRFVYQNLVSQIQKVSGSNRLQVSSMCIDGIMIAPLGETYNTFAAFSGNVGNTATNFDCTNNPYFKFDSGLNDTTAAQWSGLIQVGSAQYPTTQYNNLYLTADSTLNHYWSNSMAQTSLLFLNNDANIDVDTPSLATVYEALYVPLNFLNTNTVWVQSFSLEDGWSSPQKVLSGIDTSSTNVETIVIQSGISNTRNFLMVGLLSSVIEFDTIAKRIRVIQ
jgi:hypothetical protein